MQEGKINQDYTASGDSYSDASAPKTNAGINTYVGMQ